MEISGLIAKIGVDLTEFERGIAKMQSRLEDAASKMATVGKKMSVMLTAPLKAVGVAGFKLYKDYESVVTQIVSLTDVSKEAYSTLEGDIKRIAAETGTSLKDVADGFYFIASSGFEGAAAIDILEKSTKAAAAGLGSASDISQLLTSVLTAYGSENIDAAKATDILIRAVKDGKAEASELATTLGRVLPVASLLGIKFDEVAAAVSGLTLIGMNAPEAVTAIRGVLMEMLNMSQQGKDALLEMGTSYEELYNTLKTEGFLPFLQDIDRLINQFGEQSISKVFKNVHSLTGVLGLVGENFESVEAIFKDIAAAEGDLDAAFKNTQQTLEYKWKVAVESAKGAIMELGTGIKGVLVPVLEGLTKFLSKVSEYFASLSDKTKTTIVTIAGLVAAIGPALLIFSKITKVIGGLIPKLVNLRTSFVAFQTSILAGTTGLKGFNLVFATLGNLVKTNPFGLIATGLALIIPLLIKAFKGYKDLNAEISLTEKLQRDLNEEISQAAAGLEQEKVEINAVVKSIMDYNVGSKERILALEELKKKYPDYFKNIDAEKVTNAELTKILENVNKSYEERIKLAQASAKVSILTNKIVENQIKSEEALYKRQEAIAGMQKYWSKDVIEKFKQRAAETGKSLDLILYEEAKIISQGIGYSKNELRSWIAQYEEANSVLVRSEEALKFYNEQLEKTINENIKNGDVISKSNEVYNENTKVIKAETDKQISIWQEYYSNLSTIYANLSNENLKFGADNLDFLIKTRDDIKNETNKQIEDWLKFLLTKKNLSKKEIDEINKYIIDSGALTLEILKKLDTEIAAAIPVEKMEIKGGIITDKIDTSYLDEYIAKQNELKKAYNDSKISYEQYIKAIATGNYDLDAMITKNRMIADTMNYLKKVANDTFMTLAEGLGAAMTGAADFGKVFLNTIFDVIKGLLQLAASYLVEAIFEKQSRLYASLGPPGIVLLLATAGAAIAGISALQSQIMGLAEGGLVTKGGAFVVGERGREIVTLPAGSAVTPVSKMAKNNFYLDGELRARVRGEDLEFVLNRVSFKNKKR